MCSEQLCVSIELDHQEVDCTDVFLHCTLSLLFVQVSHMHQLCSPRDICRALVLTMMAWLVVSDAFAPGPHDLHHTTYARSVSFSPGLGVSCSSYYIQVSCVRMHYRHLSVSLLPVAGQLQQGTCHQMSVTSLGISRSCTRSSGCVKAVGRPTGKAANMAMHCSNCLKDCLA